MSSCATIRSFKYLLDGNLAGERGVALAAAIFAIVVVGLLVAGSFLIATWERRIGGDTVLFRRATAAAEAGAELTLARWERGAYSGMLVGDSTAYSGPVGANSGWFRTSVHRLNDELFFVASEGFSADFAARHTVGVLARVQPVDVEFAAALEVFGPIWIGSSAVISGRDSDPAGWTGCPHSTGDLPAIRIVDSSHVEIEVCPECARGGISFSNSSPDSALRWHGVDFADLVARASKVVGGGPYVEVGPSFEEGGRCSTADERNWGDPRDASPCASYFPVIYAPEGTRLAGGRGQGVLLVQGDLELSGGFEFVGPVFVTGILVLKGAGASIVGGVSAANSDPDRASRLERGTIQYSGCAVWRALTRAAGIMRLLERSWVAMN
ncbi:MAG: hypothetical protein V3R24_06515 [Gemmatimonadales bacterium]